MGCSQTSVMRLPDNSNQAARAALAHRPRAACGSRRSLAVVPLIGYQRYYGETPLRRRRDCRPIRGTGPERWRWVRGQRLAFWGSQPGLERSTETPATGQGAKPRRSRATDSIGRQPFPRAGRRGSGQGTAGKRRQGLRAIATRGPAWLPALTIPESKAGQAR